MEPGPLPACLPACLVGAAGLDKARAMTGAKLFLNRTRDAAGVPAVDSASGAPPKLMSSFISRQTAIKASNHCTSHGPSLGWGHARTIDFTLAGFVLLRID